MSMNRRHIHGMIAAWAATLALAGAVAHAGNATEKKAALRVPGPQADIHAEVLEAFAQGDERVRVVVALKESVDFGAMDLTQKTEVESLKARVKTAQEAVLNGLAKEDCEVIHQYNLVPGFSAFVTLQGYKQLLADPRVGQVKRPMMIYSQIANALPQIEDRGFTRGRYDGMFFMPGEDTDPEGDLPKGVTIGVVDTGIEFCSPYVAWHPDLRWIEDYDGPTVRTAITNKLKIIVYLAGGQYANDHGTAVAGIAAGQIPPSSTDLVTCPGSGFGDPNNCCRPGCPIPFNDYVGGMAYNAALCDLKISSDAAGSSTEDTMAAAWDWAAAHRDIVPEWPIMILNTSFGGGAFTAACDDASSVGTAAAQACEAAGITLFAASGNDGYVNAIAWPACISNVVSVGAVLNTYVYPYTGEDQVASYSNTADILTMLAPSDETDTTGFVTDKGQLCSYDDACRKFWYHLDFNGTSAACPYAAGAAAALQGSYRRYYREFMKPARLREVMRRSGVPIRDNRPVALGLPPIYKNRLNFAAMIDMGMHNTSEFFPPIPDQQVDGYPRYGSVDYGASMGYAVGYSMKTNQEWRQLRHNYAFLNPAATSLFFINPMTQRSPYYILNNGGGGRFQFAGDLITGHGVPSVFEYGRTDTGFVETPIYGALGQFPLFKANKVRVDKVGRFASNYNNNITAVKDHLDTGESCVIGIPVFRDFDSHDFGVYTEPEDRTLLGYQALTIVGYDDNKLEYVGTKTYSGAFLARNSWGTDWGTGPRLETSGSKGYVWLSYEFVRRYCIEAWALVDDRNDQWVLTGTVLSGRTFSAVMKDYEFEYTYSGPEFPHWNETIYFTIGDNGREIKILNGGPNDVLTLTKRPGVPFPSSIARVESSGNFSRIYTEANINEIICDKYYPDLPDKVPTILKSVTAKDAYIGRIESPMIENVSMYDSNSFTWPEISGYLANQPVPADPNEFNKLRNTPSHVSIIETARMPKAGSPYFPAAYTHRLKVDLAGVILKEVRAPLAELTLTMSSKKTTAPNYSTYLSYGGVGGPTDAIIEVNELKSAKITGADFMPTQLLAHKIGKITVKGLNFTTKYQPLGGKNLVLKNFYGGDVTSQMFRSTVEGIDLIQAIGGDINTSQTLAHQNIKKIQARSKNYVLQYASSKTKLNTGGHVGVLDNPSTMVVSAGYPIGFLDSELPPSRVMSETELNQFAPNFSNITLVQGDWLVSGLFAGGITVSSDVYTPNFFGYVKTLKTKSKAPAGVTPSIPRIEGQSWSRTPVKLASPDTLNFTQN